MVLHCVYNVVHVYKHVRTCTCISHSVCDVHVLAALTETLLNCVVLCVLRCVCSWIGSRSPLHLAPCVTCCGLIPWKTLGQRNPLRRTTATTLFEDVPTTTGTHACTCDLLLFIFVSLFAASLSLPHSLSQPPAITRAVSSYRGIACSPSFEPTRHRMLATRCTARALQQAFPPSSQYSLHQTISMCMGTKVQCTCSCTV